MIQSERKMNERIKKSLTLINTAKEMAKVKDYQGALRAYAEAFYLRSVDEGFFDIEYAIFYRYQFKTYLAGKRNFTLSLPEGDMIADLIRSTYEDMRLSMASSPFNITSEGTMSRLKEVHIDFPCQDETDFEDEIKSVSL